MSYQDHLKTCEYCNRGLLKPTISVKSAFSYNRRKKLCELAAIIKGISYPSLEPIFQCKGASSSNIGRRPGPIEREIKLKALGRLVRG